MPTMTDLRWHTCTPDKPWRDDMGKRGRHARRHARRTARRTLKR